MKANLISGGILCDFVYSPYTTLNLVSKHPIMSYKVLARKWRPQTFSEIIGQSHITKTLRNAIKKNRVGHAYLFVGPRGIGKTTSARIFAKALNCLDPIKDNSGNIEPCCNCITCNEITTGNCLDVIEIDGASNNKVDDIRSLRETIPYAPTNGRKFKIYIIDEVHMLTTGAWNALLKTLEEPPSHVKFFFATTEAHKILDTIISRCQRFDFRRIPVPAIVTQLRKISEKERISIEDSALTVIARAANGGMRDAQSIFDQIIAFCSGENEEAKIVEADVINVFGLTSNKELKQLVVALINNSPSEIISNLHELADHGRNLERLFRDLLLYLRNLMIFHHARDPKRILELDESEFADLADLQKISSASIIQKLIEGFMSYESNIKNYLNKRVFIEVTILRVMREAHSVSIDTLISQLKSIKKKNEEFQSGNSDRHEQPENPEIKSEMPVWKNEHVQKAPVSSQLHDPSNEYKLNKIPQKPQSISDQSEKVAPTLSEKRTTGNKKIEWKKEILSTDHQEPSTIENHSLGYSPDQESKSSEATDSEERFLSVSDTAPKVPEITDASPVKTSQKDVHKENLSRRDIWEAMERNEFVQSVCTLFEGNIVDVRGKGNE